MSRVKDQFPSPTMTRWLRCTSTHLNSDWNKYDDRLMKAAERGEADKMAAVLAKKGVVPTKLDVEGRSAFHLAATRGHLDCLSLMLGHSVDITAKDATGKNALHLASRNGHSMCVQKLLQCHCPVGNVDLQGRTALHDAVMADCPSSVQLLLDGGASVNANDFEGKTPLILATQMCHPRICQLLLDRGADLSIRDKHSKTALILGCEFGCQDAVEVLLRCGADPTAVDGLGHDALHYARLGRNTELVMLLKSHLDRVDRDKQAARVEQWKRQYSMESSEAAESSRRDQVVQDLERQNENLQESLRKFHQEQKTLLDTISLLQQQLDQEKTAADDTRKEKEQLKVLLSSKERDETVRGSETVKVQLRSSVGEYSGQSVIKGKENLLVKQAHSLDSEHKVPGSGPDQSPPAGAAVWDVSAELDAVRHQLDAARRKQQAAEEEVARLQSALSRKTRECRDLVQSRDAVQQQADRQVRELEDALGDVQKRMLDSECRVKQLQAHVEAVKERLGGEELRDVKAKYEGASAEVGRLRNRLRQSEAALEEYRAGEGRLVEERDSLADALSQSEARLAEARAAAAVSAEKFDNMKNLLSDAVDEKERQLAELRDDYDRVLEEVAELHRRQDGGSASSALEEHNASLKRRLVEVTAKSQALIQEVEEGEEERRLLRQQAEEQEDIRRNMAAAVEELEDKLVEAGERYGRAEAEVQQLQENLEEVEEQRSRLSIEVEEKKSQLERHVKEVEEQKTQLERRVEEVEEQKSQLATTLQLLQQSLDEQYVPRQQHEEVRAELASALQRAQDAMSKVEETERDAQEELKNVREGKEKLTKRLEQVLLEMQNDFVSVKEHREVTDRLNAAAIQAEDRAHEARAEVHKLTQELEAQKSELDAIQNAVQSKMEEKESCYASQLTELSARLQEAQEEHRQEKEKLTEERQRVELALEKDGQMQEELHVRHMEASQKWAESEERLQEAERHNADLEERCASSTSQILDLQERLKSQLARISTYDSELQLLQDGVRDAQVDCKKAREAQQQEAHRAAVLQKELQEQRRDQEVQVRELRRALREEEETSAQRAEDVSALQLELLQATQALEEVRRREEEEETASLRSKLLSLERECEEAHREAAAARGGESRARAEAEAVQEKGRSIEKEVQDLKVRYDQSMSTISDLQRRIHTSTQQTQAKDQKITELLVDVERLKQALNGLSQLAYSGATNKRQMQNIDTLQAQIRSLQQQLADAERQHRDVVSIYRTHLLSAAQGHMDEDVQAALLQIIRMRQEFLC